MKKFLALALSLLMVFAVCVPAFATNNEINQSDATNNKADIKTTIPTDISSKDGYYKVTFPASTDIAWSTVTSDTTLACTVYSNLLNNKTLKVTVAAAPEFVVSGDYVMKKNADTIKFTLTDATFNKNKSLVGATVADGKWEPKVHIEKADWDKAPIGADYSAKLTFTVSTTTIV